MPLNFLSHSCYALEFFSHLDYPSVPLNFFFRTHPAVPLKKIFFCTYEYPAVPLFFYALTLLCHYFSTHLPCCALIFSTFFAKFFGFTLLCHFFHLPCCAHFFGFSYSYPAVPFFRLHCCAQIFVFIANRVPFFCLPCCLPCCAISQEEKALVTFLLLMSDLGQPVPNKVYTFASLYPRSPASTTTDNPIKPPGKNWARAFEKSPAEARTEVRKC